MTEFLYHYKMKVTKVVDGDTVYGDVDLGFNFGMKKMEFRLAEVNTPETKGETRTAGLVSKKFVEDAIFNKEVCILTKKLVLLALNKFSNSINFGCANGSSIVPQNSIS